MYRNAGGGREREKRQAGGKGESMGRRGYREAGEFKESQRWGGQRGRGGVAVERFLTLNANTHDGL